MKKLLPGCVLCAILPVALHAAEPGVQPMTIEAQPLTFVRDGEVQGCGVRLTGGVARVPASSWFDVSLNVFRRGVGLGQAIAYEIRRSDYDGESRPERVPIQHGWVKASARTPRVAESLERRDALVYTLLADEVLSVFEAVANGRPVTVGLKRWGEREDSTYTGTPVLTEEGRATMSACLAKLSFD